MDSVNRRAGSVSPEEELTLRLARVAELRARDAGLIRELVGSADLAAFESLTRRRGVFGVLGKRLLEVAPEAVSPGFRRAHENGLKAGGYVSLLFEQQTLKLLRSLELASVSAVTLKGPVLARRVHGDPALRSSVDIDILIAGDAFEAAVQSLRSEGYGLPVQASWANGLPLFECTLPPDKPWMPSIDLHWRLHWYETDYPTRALARSVLQPDGWRQLQPADELTSLLLTFARDGFNGLKLAVDMAAWWDTHGHLLGGEGLEPVLEAHPHLRSAMTTAVDVVEGLVGVPARRLLPSVPELGRKGRLARRLCNWSGRGSAAQQEATVSLVDWLLTPHGERRAFLRRHLFPPPSVIAQVYSLPEGARIRLGLGRARYGAIVGWSFATGYVVALWRVRGGRLWSPIPASEWSYQ